MSGGQGWEIRLAQAAEADVTAILKWTLDRFGTRQARVYERTLKQALQALREGPDIAGVRPLAAVGAETRMLHVARVGRKGRHMVVFRARVDSGRGVIEVLRTLHDTMEPRRHLPEQEKAPTSSQAK